MHRHGQYGSWTLRIKDNEGRWEPRTPAMVPGLADDVLWLEEWIRILDIESNQDKTAGPGSGFNNQSSSAQAKQLPVRE